MKEETGLLVMKNGKAWGTVYADGHSHEYGWVDPVEAELHNPRYCKKPTDVTYEGSHYTKELSTATLVPVRKVTYVEIVK